MTTIDTVEPPPPREIDATKIIRGIGSAIRWGRNRAASAAGGLGERARSLRRGADESPPELPPGYHSEAVMLGLAEASNIARESIDGVAKNKVLYDRVTLWMIMANGPRQMLYFLAIILPAVPPWNENDPAGWGMELAKVLAPAFVLMSIPLGLDLVVRGGVRQLGMRAIPWYSKLPALAVMIVMSYFAARISYACPLPPLLEPYRWLMAVPSLILLGSELMRLFCRPSHKIVRKIEARAYADVGAVAPPPPPPPPPPPVKKTRNTQQERLNQEAARKMLREMFAADPNAKVVVAHVVNETGTSAGTVKKIIDEVKAEIAKAAQAEADAKAAQKKADQRQAKRDRAAERKREQEKAEQDKPDEVPPAEPEPVKPIKAVRPPRPRGGSRRPSPNQPPLPPPDKDADALDQAAKASGPTRRRKVNGERVPEPLGVG